MNRLTPPSRPRLNRRGTTLTEVLMSLMIMSIGVVSLATLFPISAARVLEATNLTNATVLKYNAEGIIDSFPAIIHEPDGTTIDPVTSQRTRESGRAIQVDPLGFWERFRELDVFDDGSLNGSPSVTDQRLVYFEYNRPTLLSLPYRQNPAGSLLTTRFLGESPTSTSIFSSLDIARLIATLPDTSTDFGEGFPDPTASNPAVYTVNSEGRVTAILLPSEIDLSPLALPTTDPNYQSPTLYQAVIFDTTGDYSEVRQLTSVTLVGAQYQISWARDLNGDGSFQAGEDLPLPVRYSPDTGTGLTTIGRVRIEQPTSSYTWMLTVRKQASGPANVDVVVFNKRDFSELADQVYICDLRRYTLGPDDAPGQAGVDDNFNGVTDDISEIGYPRNPPTNLSDDEPNFRAIVDWTPANGYGTAPLEPPLRKGGYIYDSANGLWYRIRDVEEPTAHPLDPSLGPLPDTSSTIVLEDSVARDNTEDRNGNGVIDPGEDVNGDGSIDRGGVIVPKGVVAVFPLETKVP